jgi:3',5'-nucleoside bisphosphate phosphatase
MKARYPCDLHCHTVRSDGNDTPKELLDQAVRIGMHAVAITDHDIAPPLTLDTGDGRNVDSVEYAATHGLRLILGYEFSCDTWVDDVHICGYGLDWRHPDLAAEVGSAKRSKSDAYRRLCDLLTQSGMPLDWEEDVLTCRAGDGRTVTRDPEEVQRKHVFEAMARRGYTPTWSDGKLLVRDNPELNIRRRKIGSVEAVDLIHRCGGTAVLAHPFLIDERVKVDGQEELSRGDYIERLIAAGLDGIEASYTYDKTSYKGSLTPERIEAEIRRAYGGRVGFISGGSDYHADDKKGVKNPRCLGERGISVEALDRMNERRPCDG